MQGPGGDVIDIWLGDVIALDSFENLGIHVHLPIGAILLAAGVNAEKAELPEGEPQDEGCENSEGQHEHQALKESRHTHHHAGPGGTKAAHSIDAMITQGEAREAHSK